ncbi:hypothetical protein H0H81_003949 [Sphagnurus paluster]|uniref:S-adenosyl-L-methionine-dependent methyltransferase n=1 Tax=Sphagnurus paluster TaxID=117069 RepID=A0A9P7FYL8_9AGAR|nr:hypothetical protein H0H81_003949 [Sphagnurus paluster]
MSSQPAAHSLVQEKLREIVKDGNPLQASVTPWDAGASQPALRELVESGKVPLPRSGRALVPGCGAGYDAIYIADTLTLDTTGMDVAPTAIANANATLASARITPPGRASFVLGDFFTLDPKSDEERFDLVYDYTFVSIVSSFDIAPLIYLSSFFVAIPPTQRPAWARQMAALVKPGGFLVTLVYPIDPPTELGPPYFVRVEHHEALWADKGEFVKVYDEVPANSSESHVGRERIVVWKRA